MSNHKIYICHQYYTPEHFKALYDCAEENGYSIEDYFILSKRNIVGRLYKKIKSGHVFEAVRQAVIELHKISVFKRLNGQNLIVGLAPYDYILTRYAKIFKRNKSVYFTSFTGWNTEKVDRGSISNREKFMSCLKEDFIGAACVSNQTAYELQPYINNTIVVAHAIDYSNYIKKADFSRNKQFIFIGRITEVKNIRLICEWFAKHDEAAITIVGDGDEVEYVNSCCKRNDNIHYAGTWTKNQIKKNLHKFDFLILPSKKEPYGIVLLEAMASGVPCIVSNANGPCEIIENNRTGLIFDLGNSDSAFNEVMEQSLKIDDETYKGMVLSAIESSRRYSSEHLVKRWISFFE